MRFHAGYAEHIVFLHSSFMVVEYFPSFPGLGDLLVGFFIITSLNSFFFCSCVEGFPFSSTFIPLAILSGPFFPSFLSYPLSFFCFSKFFLKHDSPPLCFGSCFSTFD